MYPVCELNISPSNTCFSPQQTSDNMESVKEIEQRVQSLSGVLTSPVSEDDYAEKVRRVELRRYVSLRTYVNLLILSQEA